MDMAKASDTVVTNSPKWDSSGKDTILESEDFGTFEAWLEGEETPNVVETDQVPILEEPKCNVQFPAELRSDPGQMRLPARDIRFTYFRKKPYARMRQALFDRVEALPIEDIDDSFFAKLENLIS